MATNLHLLFTDPSTSPRTELGRIIFGVLYGLSAVLLYELLGAFGMQTFDDKLLQVPLLHLSIKLIDRAVRLSTLQRFDPARRRQVASPAPAEPRVRVGLGSRLCHHVRG